LPGAEAKRFLIDERGFNSKGAGDLIAEYQKTITYLESHSAPADIMELSQRPTAHSTSAKNMPAVQINDIKIAVDGLQLRVTATVDGRGLKKLIKLLQANSALLESGDAD
jgi:hypothetical protein